MDSGFQLHFTQMEPVHLGYAAGKHKIDGKARKTVF